MALPRDRAPKQLPERDLDTFNRRLCVVRFAAVAVLVVATLVAYSGEFGDPRESALIALAGALALVSLVGLRVDASRTSLGFLRAQLLGDVVGITIGIALAGRGGVGSHTLRLLYAMAIVPASLISVRLGLEVALASSAGSIALLALERGLSLATLGRLDGFLPPLVFVVLAEQAFFFGKFVERKSRLLSNLADRLKESHSQVAAEGRLAAELAEAARKLSATLELPEPLAMVSETIRTRLLADWSAIFVVDELKETFVLRSLSSAATDGADVNRSEFRFSSWPAVAQLREHRAVLLSGQQARRLPHLFTMDRPLATALLAGLYRNETLVGFVAVGYSTPLVAAREWAVDLLTGIAEHTAIVLQNACLLEEIRAASELKSEFIGAVSHELRSPLNVILGYLEMTLDEALGPLTPEQSDSLARVHRYAHALLEMISALLDLNRFEAGRMPLQSEPVSLEALLRELGEQIPDAWRKQGVELSFDCEAGLPVVETDRAKLKTVVRNLVHNALKFTERGSVRVRAGTGPAGHLLISVADTGRGIPDAARDYIFDMFRQVPGSGGGGVGLGLHIVRRFVEVIGGAVQVESTVGRGSRFTIVLPRTLPVAPAAEAEPEAAIALGHGELRSVA